MKKRFNAEKENLQDLIKFVHRNIDSYVDEKTISKIELVIEEIFINIVNYAYKDEEEKAVCVDIRKDNQKMIITFEDNGIPFNPLDNEDPDIRLNAEERQIGGLGIYLVKKIMDDVKYLYKENKNILIIEKNIDKEN